MDGVRLDKWLWAARFFKTRALAARACELGRVASHGQPVKPARVIHAGSQLAITTEGGQFEVEVLGLSETRGPAAVAHAVSGVGGEQSRKDKGRRGAESDGRVGAVA